MSNEDWDVIMRTGDPDWEDDELDEQNYPPYEGTGFWYADDDDYDDGFTGEIDDDYDEDDWLHADDDDDDDDDDER